MLFCQTCALPRCVAEGYDVLSSSMQVKRYDAHRSRVNDLSFDERAEHVASCSDDGSVVVRRTAATLYSTRHACAASQCMHAPSYPQRCCCSGDRCHGCGDESSESRRGLLMFVEPTVPQVTGLYSDDVVRSRHRDAIAVRPDAWLSSPAGHLERRQVTERVCALLAGCAELMSTRCRTLLKPTIVPCRRWLWTLATAPGRPRSSSVAARRGSCC